MTRAIALALLLLAGCPAPASEQPHAVVGCGKDTDCKDDRICIEGRCSEPSRSEVATAAAPAPSPPSVAPPPAPSEPTVSQPPSSAKPPPPASSDVASGSRPDPRCGCKPGDVMCSMKCAQKGNAAGPSTFPSDGQPAPEAACGCAKADLMCQMRCAKEK